ncbi:MAG: LysR family transcriptional regulator, partial [Pseudobdellovibrionaceae bacterium]
MRHSDLESILEQSIFRPEVAHFLRVAALKNISKAAESLGITQPQLSKSMAGLEHSLGQTLFIRKSRGVELTSAGQSLVDRLSHLYKYFSESPSSGHLERVKIGFHPSIAMQIYPLVIHPLQNSDSRFRIETLFETSLEVTRKVAELE